MVKNQPSSMPRNVSRGVSKYIPLLQQCSDFCGASLSEADGTAPPLLRIKDILLAHNGKHLCPFVSGVWIG